jgi:hypothetical protein
MPKPFLELTVEQFAQMVRDFPWRRDITEVHLHHTYRPNHADFNSRLPIQSIEGMYRFHTEVQKWSDIAQHVSVDPDGKIWTGRNWNVAPASATGFNGNANAGPFMIEMIGDFDIGHDVFEGAQQDAAVQVIALVQKRFGLSPSAFRFHREMSPKSCPGTSLKKPDVLALVEEASAKLAAEPRSLRKGAFNDAASASREATERLLRLFNVDTAGRSHPGIRDEGELPEESMTFRELAMASGDAAAAISGNREIDDSDLTPAQLTELRKYVINLRMGAFSTGGIFQTTPDDVRAIFKEHLPAFLEQRKNAGGKLRVVLFAHGGLNDEKGSLKNARNRYNYYLQNDCYPLFFVWETGVQETLIDIFGEASGIGHGRGIGETVSSFTDPVLESLFRGAGFSMWANMKRSAEISFLPKQGGAFLVGLLADFWRQNSADMEIHAIGHSAGSIFHAYFLKLLCEQDSKPLVESLHFLAPAITIDLFKETLLPLIGKSVKTLAEYTMHKDFELADSVGPYRKSLLYLVSRSFEDNPETTLLGLEESIRRDPDIVRFFGLLGNKPKAELLFSVREDGPSHSTIAKKHGDFDNDRLTMGSVMRRILRVNDDVTIVEFPETVSRELWLSPSPAAAIAASPAPVQFRGFVRKKALCIGIDNYAAPNTLFGCVNDARAWADWLRSLGFDVTLLSNDQATWKAITSALENMTASTAAGDIAVLQYSGHGTLVDDLDGDEHGGKDSALCPVDFDGGGFLIDDDVRRILGRSLPAGVNLTCFFDCCHSGTITRLLAPTLGTGARGGTVRVRGLHATPAMLEAHKRFRAALGAPAPVSRGPATMKEISFTACTDSQTAQEIDGHGVFTTQALEILRGGPSGFTNGAFHKKIQQAFDSSAGQTPSLDCAPSAIDQPLFGRLNGLQAGGTGSPDDLASRLADIERRLGKLGV